MNGRRVIITGSRGARRAARAAFSIARGACGAARRSPSCSSRWPQAAAARPGSSATWPTATRSTRRAVERLGGLEVAVANAGIGAQMTLVDGDPKVWDATIDVNLNGTYNLIRAAGPHVAHPRGKLLPAHSVARGGGSHLPLMAAYCASKAAVESLGDSLHLELALGRTGGHCLLRRARHRHDLAWLRHQGGGADADRRQRAPPRRAGWAGDRRPRARDLPPLAADRVAPAGSAPCCRSGCSPSACWSSRSAGVCPRCST